MKWDRRAQPSPEADASWAGDLRAVWAASWTLHSSVEHLLLLERTNVRITWVLGRHLPENEWSEPSFKGNHRVGRTKWRWMTCASRAASVARAAIFCLYDPLVSGVGSCGAGICPQGTRPPTLAFASSGPLSPCSAESTCSVIQSFTHLFTHQAFDGGLVHEAAELFSGTHHTSPLHMWPKSLATYFAWARWRVCKEGTPEGG